MSRIDVTSADEVAGEQLHILVAGDLEDPLIVQHRKSMLTIGYVFIYDWFQCAPLPNTKYRCR